MRRFQVLEGQLRGQLAGANRPEHDQSSTDNKAVQTGSSLGKTNLEAIAGIRILIFRQELRVWNAVNARLVQVVQR